MLKVYDTPLRSPITLYTADSVPACHLLSFFMLVLHSGHSQRAGPALSSGTCSRSVPSSSSTPMRLATPLPAQAVRTRV